MPFEVTDNATGKVIVFEKQPSEADLKEAFGAIPPQEKHKVLTHSFLREAGSEFIDKAVGIPETIASAGTGLLAQPISYLGGAVMGAVKGGEEGKAFREYLADTYTYKPQTEYGKKATGVIGNIMSPFGIPRKIGEGIGKSIDVATGNKTKNWEEGFGNLMEAPLQAWGLKAGMKGLEKRGIVSKTPEIAKIQSEAKVNQEINKVIKDDFYQTVKPSVADKKTLAQLKQSINRAGSAEKYIVENKANLEFIDDTTGIIVKGEIPKTALQNAQAWKQMMDSIWEQANAKVMEKNGTGITVSYAPLMRQLKAVIEKNKTASPSIAKEAVSLIERLEKQPELSFVEVQAQLAQINSRLGGKATATYSEHGAMQVDSIHAKYLRNALEKNIEGIKDLRNLYADFKAAEAAITKTAARKLNIDPNRMDFLDIGSITAATTGALSLNPMPIIAGGVIRGLNIYRHRMKDPDYRTQKMYEKIDKIVEKDKGFDEAFRSGLPKNETPKTQIEYIRRMGMADDSFVTGVKAKFNNPEYWNKNRDAIERLLSSSVKKPVTEGQMNELLYRIMLKIDTKKSVYEKRQKPLSSLERDFWGPDNDLGTR